MPRPCKQLPLIEYSPHNILDRLNFSINVTFHAQRTFEAYRFLGHSIEFYDVMNCYLEIEKFYSPVIKKNNNESIRIIFSKETPLHYSVEVLKNITLPDVVMLKPVRSFLKDCFKWQDRSHWQLLLKENTADDVLTYNAIDFLIETSRFNLFLFNIKEDCVFTPTLQMGCVNGVLRRASLTANEVIIPSLGSKKIFEKDFRISEVAQNQLYVGNAIRGFLKAQLDG